MGIDLNSVKSIRDDMMRDHALNYASQGWSVFPCRGKFPARPKDKGGSGCKDASQDHIHVFHEWMAYHGANIGIATGADSGVFVLDIDGDEGEESLRTLIAQYGDLPRTVEAITGSGGRHIYFRHPGKAVKTSASEVGTNLDVRGDGGYVIAPPSIHPDTLRRYEWNCDHHPDETPIADAPAWLLALAIKPEPAAPSAPSQQWHGAQAKNEPYVAAALHNAVTTISAAPIGKQDHILNKTVYGIGRLVGGGELPFERAEADLVAAGLQMANDPTREPWTEADIREKVRRSLEDGMQNPKTVPERAPFLQIGSDVEIARCLTEDLKRQHGQVLSCDGFIWRYTGTHWSAFTDQDLRAAVYRYDGAGYQTPAGMPAAVKLTKGKIDSILHEARSMLLEKSFFKNAPTGINCANGFIVLDAGEPRLLPHSPDHRARHTLPGKWGVFISDEQYRNSRLNTLLTGVFQGDEDADQKRDLLAEIAGVAALGYATKIASPKAAILKGEMAGNGKSQVLDTIRAMLPPDAVSSIPPVKFSDEKYVVGLIGKLLNTSDELKAGAIAGEVFKQVITGDPIDGRDLYKSVVEFRSQAQNIFSANELPPFHGGMDRGVRRRLMVIPFNRVIPENERIAELGKLIGQEEPDILLAWAVAGAQRLLAQGAFTEPASSEAALIEWVYGTDPVAAWLDCAVTVHPNRPDLAVVISHAYQHFKEWATKEGYASAYLPAVNTFSTRVRNAAKGVGYKHTGKGRFFLGVELDYAANQ